MAEPFLGEIRAFSFNYAPRGWALCQGQLMAISQFSSLYSLIGTIYGGDGRTSFALPDLRGRATAGQDSYTVCGYKGGVESVPLTVAQIPPHTHRLRATAQAANTNDPTNQGLASSPVYTNPENFEQMHADVLKSPGTQAHNNMQPSLVINYCIAITGIFPSRN